MTDQTELPKEQLDRLLDIYMSGFTAGMTTMLVSRLEAAQRDAPLSESAIETVVAAATVYASGILDDPAVRHELTADLAKIWATGTANEFRVMTLTLGVQGGGQG